MSRPSGGHRTTGKSHGTCTRRPRGAHGGSRRTSPVVDSGASSRAVRAGRSRAARQADFKEMQAMVGLVFISLNREGVCECCRNHGVSRQRIGWVFPAPAWLLIWAHGSPCSKKILTATMSAGLGMRIMANALCRASIHGIILARITVVTPLQKPVSSCNRT